MVIFRISGTLRRVRRQSGLQQTDRGEPSAALLAPLSLPSVLMVGEDVGDNKQQPHGCNLLDNDHDDGGGDSPCRQDPHEADLSNSAVLLLDTAHAIGDYPSLMLKGGTQAMIGSTIAIALVKTG